MKAYILSDSEYETPALLGLRALVERVLEQKGFSVTEKRLQKDELAFCMGCFGCWIKTPGECVIGDAMTEINRETAASDAVIYLTPIVFGQFSANIKSALDRWIPNILPFFIRRENGETMHPARYEKNPQYIMLGYGDGLTAEEKRVFTEITTRHRENGAVLIYEGDDAATEQALMALDWQKAGDCL